MPDAMQVPIAAPARAIAALPARIPEAAFLGPPPHRRRQFGLPRRAGILIGLNACFEITLGR